MQKVTHIDLNKIMDDYTAQVNAEERRRQAIRNAHVAGSTEILTPAPETWVRWNISDRH